MKPDLQKIQIVPQEKTGPIFAQRESGVRHTPYQAETAFYNCIKAGDCALLERKMEEYFQSGFVVGRLSGDPAAADAVLGGFFGDARHARRA